MGAARQRVGFCSSLPLCGALQSKHEAPCWRRGKFDWRAGILSCVARVDPGVRRGDTCDSLPLRMPLAGDAGGLCGSSISAAITASSKCASDMVGARNVPKRPKREWRSGPKRGLSTGDRLRRGARDRPRRNPTRSGASASPQGLSGERGRQRRGGAKLRDECSNSGSPYAAARDREKIGYRGDFAAPAPRGGAFLVQRAAGPRSTPRPRGRRGGGPRHARPRLRRGAGTRRAASPHPVFCGKPPPQKTPSSAGCTHRLSRRRAPSRGADDGPAAKAGPARFGSRGS